MIDPQLSTGLPALDRVFKGLIPGDNLVWQVESLADFTPLVAPYGEAALARGRKLIYFRFGDHEPLVPEGLGATVHQLSTTEGFERFITQIHRVIQEAGQGACFVFDCLSTLAEAWCSDRMLGNFFMLTCPYVYDRQSLAYFPLLRNCHSFQASTPIAETTQILVDVYRHLGHLYLHPTKVQQRYSATMYMLHRWDGDQFLPVTESSTIAEILTAQPWAGLESVRLRLGKWNRTFLQAEEVWEGICRGQRTAGEADQLLPELLRMAISRDQRVTRLARRHLTLPDVLGIWKRMIGTGLIGGKSVGMLLARAILKRADPRWNDLLEAHDSFFIGSDVFYSFLVENGCWWLRQKQRDPSGFLDNVEEVRRRILVGNFADHIVKEFSEMLDYFGQSPIIVRSSSLLEDNYGNAFSGKYESVFCANQGPHHKRLQDFLSAVKTIYASTMSEKALRYRAQRGLLDEDEQMSLLVQRVSGVRCGGLFYPQVAGVGLSRNPYVWNKCIDPEAGVVRLVFGLGTRAVDRSDDDYTRIVALNAPQRRPESDVEEVRQYSQRKVDVIDLEANQLVSREFTEVAEHSPRLPVHIFASADAGIARRAEPTATPGNQPPVLTFEYLLSQTPFVADMRQMLKILQDAYDYPVDLEFTANFSAQDRYKINVVQCRPLQVASDTAAVELPESVSRDDCVLEAHGAVIGQSRVHLIDRLVYVPPSVYGQLPIRDRYSIARLIGRLLHLDDPQPPRRVMLVGPGRWGTTTPSLGVPISFAEIDTASVLCEIVAMRDDLVPDVSLGTHFFNDLVEMDILYLALFPGRKDNFWNLAFFDETPNRLAELLPGEAQWAEAVRVIDLPAVSHGGAVLKLNANALTQQVVCYLDRDRKSCG
jgi:pyruvate, water dikinase